MSQRIFCSFKESKIPNYDHHLAERSFSLVNSPLRSKFAQRIFASSTIFNLDQTAEKKTSIIEFAKEHGDKRLYHLLENFAASINKKILQIKVSDIGGRLEGRERKEVVERIREKVTQGSNLSGEPWKPSSSPEEFEASVVKDKMNQLS